MNRAMRIMSVLLLVLLVVAVPQLQAFWIEDGIPVCALPEPQNYPETVYGGAGHTLITWVDLRDVGDRDIYAQHLDEIGSTLWKDDGLDICTASGYQEFPQITDDGGGGAIIAWQDLRGSDDDIYVQRVKFDGTIQWALDGVPVCTAAGGQEHVQIVSDEADGAIIVWRDHRGADEEIFAQRISDTGKIYWATDGVSLCTASTFKSSPQVHADGSGGAIVTWHEDRGDPSLYDIYAQRIDASGTLLWGSSGTPVCMALSTQRDMRIVSDGAGGAVIAWRDRRRGISLVYDIYAQRINFMGTSQWTSNGVLVCVEDQDKTSLQIASDGAGGAIMTWHETRSGPTAYDVYAQRISNSGIVQWDFDGINVSPVENGQGDPQIVSDGSGGAIIAWVDERIANSQIYAQKINGSGELQWRTGGAPVCLTLVGAENLRITEDGNGGAVAVWADWRTVDGPDIYAQWVDTGGMPGYYPTVISSVSDIRGDEGGWVRLTIQKHSYDDETWFRYPIYMYNVWRRVDDPVMLAAIDREILERELNVPATSAMQEVSPDESSLSNWPIMEIDGRRFLVASELLPVQEFPPGTWEVLGSFNAFRQDEYLYVASTPSDSTSAMIPMPVFCVSAHPLDPSQWYVSAPDSGYSVDNLAPATPIGLAGTPVEGLPGIDIEWDPNSENDFSHYIVHRGSFATFMPSTITELGATASPAFTDEYELWYTSYYKICAVDRHGNNSVYAILGPGDLTGDDLPGPPRADYLSQNYPNPFNPNTTIAFGLKSDGFVSLGVYNAAGQLVAVLIDESRPAGPYATVWNGKAENGTPAASGVYFYRLITEEFRETKKMILLR